MLPHHGGLIVEYVGMPDLPDYMEGIRHKERVYAANGLPALFLYPDDLRGPGSPEVIERRIYAATSQRRLPPCRAKTYATPPPSPPPFHLRLLSGTCHRTPSGCTYRAHFPH